MINFCTPVSIFNNGIQIWSIFQSHRVGTPPDLTKKIRYPPLNWICKSAQLTQPLNLEALKSRANTISCYLCHALSIWNPSPSLPISKLNSSRWTIQSGGVPDLCHSRLMLVSLVSVTLHVPTKAHTQSNGLYNLLIISICSFRSKTTQ